MDRAGIVGDDGKTHQGEFDISFLRSVPDIVIAAPRDGEEFRHLLYTAVNSGKTMAIRYPRGSVPSRPVSGDLTRLEIGRAELSGKAGTWRYSPSVPLSKRRSKPRNVSPEKVSGAAL